MCNWVCSKVGNQNMTNCFLMHFSKYGQKHVDVPYLKYIRNQLHLDYQNIWYLTLLKPAWLQCVMVLTSKRNERFFLVIFMPCTGGKSGYWLEYIKPNIFKIESTLYFEDLLIYYLVPFCPMGTPLDTSIWLFTNMWGGGGIIVDSAAVEFL